MYTTDRAEQALDDIRKVFLLYERDIIDKGTVEDLTNRIVLLYITKSVVLEPAGQSCQTCLYYRDGCCYGKKYAPAVEPYNCCDSWASAIKSDTSSTKE